MQIKMPKLKLRPETALFNTLQLFPYVTMKQIYAYRNHVQRHVWENFSCDCDVTFADKAAKRRHYQLVHDEKRRGEFQKCDQCCYVGRAAWLERHKV